VSVTESVFVAMFVTETKYRVATGSLRSRNTAATVSSLPDMRTEMKTAWTEPGPQSAAIVTSTGGKLFWSMATSMNCA
jgi:hypothetical protein